MLADHRVLERAAPLAILGGAARAGGQKLRNHPFVAVASGDNKGRRAGTEGGLEVRTRLDEHRDAPFAPCLGRLDERCRLAGAHRVDCGARVHQQRHDCLVAVTRRKDQ